MSETLPEDRSSEPITVDSMASDLHALGIKAGHTLLVHGSLSSLGWVCGGAPAVIDAFQRVVGEDGTIVMPTHSAGNMDPSDMGNPPVPDSWYDTIREQMPPYRPDVTPTQGMGAIAECFRSSPIRSRLTRKRSKNASRYRYEKPVGSAWSSHRTR